MARRGNIARGVFAGVALGVFAAGATMQAGRRGADPRELYRPVGSQVAALRAGDFEAARGEASAAVRERSGGGDFAEVVGEDLVEIVRGGREEFGPVDVRRNRALVQVFFSGSDGSVASCLFALVRESGQWKVESVRVQRDRSGRRQMRGVRA